MWIYLGLLAFNVISAIGCNYLINGKKIYFGLTVISLTLLSGLRGSNVGTDTSAYQDIFYQISEIVNFNDLFLFNKEIGFVLLNKTVAVIGGGPTLLFTICAFITSFGILIYLYKNVDNFYLATYILICIMFFFTSMNGVRQYLAISIGINSITLFKQKKWLQGIIIILFSMIFHKLGVLYFLIPILFLCQKFKIFNVLFFVCIICVLIFSKQIIIILAKFLGFDWYLTEIKPLKSYMLIIMYSVIFVFWLITSFFNKNLIKETRIEVYVLIICIVLAILTRTTFYYADRISWLFSLATIPLLSKCVKSYKGTDEIIVTSGVIFIFFAFFLYCLLINWQRIVPYTFFWQ